MHPGDDEPFREETLENIETITPSKYIFLSFWRSSRVHVLSKKDEASPPGNLIAIYSQYMKEKTQVKSSAHYMVKHKHQQNTPRKIYTQNYPIFGENMNHF